MEKILNKEALINEVIEMKRGEVYTLDILNEDEESIYCTMVTKTRWFDNHIVIIGGSDDETFVSKNFECDNQDIEKIIIKLINKYVSEYFNDKYDRFTLREKSEIFIESNVPCLGRGRVIDNFKYTKEKYLLEE
jgi:hypothetical protein